MPLDFDQLRSVRALELYNRLPEVYRARDWQRAFELFGEDQVRSGNAIPELESFLGIVADEIIRLRAHIGDLWDDFFIETASDWVVPYLADLLGVNLVFNAAQRNRVDVKNTIDWRRRKGILSMLAELAGDITGYNAAAAEFFENLGWSQNLNHVKRDHFQAVDLHDPYPISLIGRSNDPWLHQVDVRHPSPAGTTLGWYGIKTIGFFLSRLNSYPLTGVTAHAQGVVPGCFSFDPLGRDIPLFNHTNRQPVSAAELARDPYDFFGAKDGFAIRQHGILLAASRPITPEPTEVKELWSGFGPAQGGDPAVHLGGAGLEWMESEKFDTPMRRFKLSALWGSDFTDVSLAVLGSLTSFPVAGSLAIGAAAANPGILMLRLELAAGSDAALFPGTMVAVRNDRGAVRTADPRTSRYRDALYVYLPPAALAPGDVLNLYLAADGSTFYAHRSEPHLGAQDVTPHDLLNPDLDRTLLAARCVGQCFPARRLVNSLEPSNLADLHRTTGMRLVDEDLFAAAGRKFLIEAYTYTQKLGERIGQLPTYNEASLDPDQVKVAFHYKSLPDVDIPQGTEGTHLVLKISRAPTSTDDFFPMTELILTDRSGQALLVCLPELDFTHFSMPVWLFYDTDGASYYASNDFGHDTALSNPERGSALQFDPSDPAFGLARKSCGQVLALPGRFPLQQRTPQAANLCYWDHPKPQAPRPGQIAIDPTRGRFCFAVGQALKPASDSALGVNYLGLTVDYHEGFAHDVGALTYDRYSSLKAPENPQPTLFVSRTGDAAQGISPVFDSLAKAFNSARDGEVIQIEDSATYEQTANLVVPAGVKRMVIQSANRQRPCLHFTSGAKLQVAAGMDELRLNGLFISGAALEIADASQVRQVDLIACTFDPQASDTALAAGEGLNPRPVCQVSLCRCIGGGLKLGRGVAELVVSDSILDRSGQVVLGDLAGGEAHVQAHLERATLFGTAKVHQLYASECLLVDPFTVSDQQTGCLRYSRYQVGSRLPRRYRCVPADNSSSVVDPLTPAFNSRRFGRPDYAQLHQACPEVIQTGAENGSEMGASQGALAALRVSNLGVKLDEYLPVGLTPAVIFVS